MRLFKDAAGREWEVKLTIGSAKKLSERLKPFEIDLMNIEQVLVRFADILFFTEVIWETVRDQAEAKGITADEFLDAFSGDLLYRARQAWLNEYIDFFPDPAARKTVRELLARSEKMADLQRRMVITELEKQFNGLTSTSTPDEPGSTILKT